MTYEAQIDAAVARGHSLDMIDERLIEPEPISSQQKAALWLYAFSRQRGRQQRREVDRTLTAAGLR